ncbi:MAG: DUF3240 family protein [Burkholderiales bacterium]|jgi:nitrogen regulatory protein PII|nr:DUF3240 family protein [Burkholderiales bacterium]
MMTCLTLVIPTDLEEEVVDHLLEHPEWVPGFTTFMVSGHGQGVVYRNSAEAVRGRVGRVMVQIVTEGEKAEALLDHLKASFPHPEITWWMSPVSGQGRLA